MKLFGKTDIGMTRQINQDAFENTVLSDDAGFSVVCDGMGGAKAGNVASNLAVKAISEYVKKSYFSDMDSLAIEKMLRSAVSTANIEIYDSSVKNPDFAGMGTTAVAALIKDDTAHIVHVGDSRAYLIGEEIYQITRDHSMVQNLIEKGHLTAEEAKSHPKKNVITRAVGIREEVQCDYNEVNISDKKLLLCTDGLSGMLNSEEIFRVVNESKNEEAAERLIQAANMKNSTDNVTAVLILK